MFRVYSNRSCGNYCDGHSRRSFLQVGVAGMAAVGLPQLLSVKEASATSGQPKKDTSVILIWLDGGPGHMDMYDMKPEAPAEYRGIWAPIKTNVSGMEVTELFPLQAKIADKFSIVRSLHHDTGDHFTGAHCMLTGREAGVSGLNSAGKYPFFGAIATRVLGPRQHGMPANVAIPYAMSIGIRPGYFGGNYLGPQDNPFETEGDANAADFQVNNLTISPDITVQRLTDRRELLRSFDRQRRDMERGNN